MSRPPLDRPTDVELEILQALWKIGEGTVRDVHADLSTHREVAMTSVATMLQVMLDKGLVTRTSEKRPFKFKAVSDRAKTAEVMLSDLSRRLFGGSIKRLLQHALGAKKSTPEEMREIERLINDIDAR